MRGRLTNMSNHVINNAFDNNLLLVDDCNEAYMESKQQSDCMPVAWYSAFDCWCWEKDKSKK